MTKPKTVTKNDPPEESEYITQQDMESLKFCVTSTIKENANNRAVIIKMTKWEQEIVQKIASLNLEVMEYRKLKDKQVKKE